MPAPLICPSILASDFARLGEEVAALEAAGADWVHVDVMDGHFVPNITIGPEVVKALRPHTKLPFDVHLMVAPVDPWLEAYREAGADYLTVHPESGPHLHRTLGRIRQLGAKAGVVLNPGTPLEVLGEVIELVDGMNDCPPKPGLTDISRTRSTSSTTSPSTSSGVAGLSTTPAFAPSWRMRPSVRCRCGPLSG